MNEFEYTYDDYFSENNIIHNLVFVSIDMLERFSSRWGHVWKDGTLHSCLLYTITEVAEAIDAELRLVRSGDSRNNDKDLSVEKELTDAWMMLNKFLLVLYKESNLSLEKFLESLELEYFDEIGGSLSVIMLDVAGITVIFETYSEENRPSASLLLGTEIGIVLSRLYNILHSYNVDVIEGLAEKLDKTEQKQLAKGYAPNEG